MLQQALKAKQFISIFKNSLKYEGSATQSKMHEFSQNQQSLNAARSKIDYETVKKESQGCIMIREFLFQEEIPEYQVNFPNSYLTPTGKWNVQQIHKLLETKNRDSETPAQTENTIIMEQLENALKDRIDVYYSNQGKKNYTISVREEVQKIESMTTEEFELFMEKLKN